MSWPIAHLPKQILADEFIAKPDAVADHFSTYGEMFYIVEESKRYKLVKEDNEGPHDLTGLMASLMFCEIIEMLPEIKKKADRV